MRTFLRDMRIGIRVLAGSPGFALVAVLTLALGIASTTTVFGWIDALLLHPFRGAAQEDRLAVLEMVKADAPNGGTAISWLDYRDYRDKLKLFSGIALRRESYFTLGEAPNAQLAWGELVSANYFEVLGIQAARGRVFTREEYIDTVGANPVTVISASLWRRYFHSDPGIVGKVIPVNRQKLTIVGIAPPEFRGTQVAMAMDMWVPLTVGPQLGLLASSTFTDRGDHEFRTLARRSPGASVEQARAEAATLAANLAAAYPKTNRGVGATVLETWEEHNGVADYLFAPLRILMAVSIVVLLIVCVNVANLLLARSITRRKEFGIRFALGASRGRVVRQMLTETLILAAGGALLAVFLLPWMAESLPSLVPSVGLPVEAGYELNGRVLAFTALACVAATLASGVAPALFSLDSKVNDVLKEGGRAGSPSRASGRTRGLLVIAEVALAAVALIGAGLFGRSFWNASAIHPGFETAHVLFGRFFIESLSYTGPQIQQFTLRLRERLEAAPGIQRVSFSDFTPLSSTSGPYRTVAVEGYVPAPAELMTVNRSLITPGYFTTLQIPVLEGRDFTERDDRTGPRVMIVNQAFARRFFHGENPVGRKVWASDRWFTVVGLVRDSRYFSPAEGTRSFFYLPFRQFYSGSPELYCFVRTTGDPAQAVATLRRAVADVDPRAGAFHAVPLSEYTQVALLGQKVAASLMGALGLMCLVLAALGLYSVMSYSVNQRTQEIGIRMAMGANPAQVIAMVVRQGMVLAAAGLVLGTVIAVAASRLVAGMLVGVDAADPATFAAAALFLSAVALLATWLPARRATRIDPIAALRQQ